jgi:hypothetical protein
MPFKDFTFIAAGRLMLARLQARRASPVCLRRSRLIVGGFGCRPAVTGPTTPYTACPGDRDDSDRRQELLPFHRLNQTARNSQCRATRQYQNCQSYLMSRSLGSDGIRLYCDAVVALTFVFATVIAMAAAVIVGSNALKFSVAIIAFVLTGPIPLFACSAADANQRHLSAIDPLKRLSSPVNLDPQLDHHN